MPAQTSAEREKSKAIVQKFQRSANDTGSCEVQVALLTNKINELTDHLKKHKKDFSTQKGLLRSVGERRRHLDYLKQSDETRYTKLIQALDLRK